MNPELQRNLWLEFSLHRLIAMPVIILLLAVFVYQVSSDASALHNLATAAGSSAFVLLFLWGPKLAMESVIEEARDRTWDAQRLSSIGPWQMTWGKLLGATSYAWYGGVICLLIFILAGAGEFQKSPLLATSLLVFSALFFQAIMLQSGLFFVKNNQNIRSSVGIIFIVFVMLFVASPISVLLTQSEAISWWSNDYEPLNFTLASMIFYAAWAVFGCYRTMCEQLQVRTTPWALPAFLSFAAVYLTGFVPYPNAYISGAGMAFMLTGTLVSLIAAYLLLFFERTGTITVMRLNMRIKHKQWLRTIEELPGWPVAAMLALPCSIGAVLLAENEYRLAPLILVLFLIRDAAIYHYFSFAKQPKRTELTTLVYLGLLYWLLPALLNAMDASFLAQLIMPMTSGEMQFSLFVMLAQGGIASGLAGWRWQTSHGKKIH